MNNYFYLAIGIAVVCIGIAIYLKRKDVAKFLKADSTKQFIKKLIIEAEKEIVGTKKGQERLEWVVSRVYLIVPTEIKVFLTEDMLVDAINTIFSEIARKMDDGTTKAVEEMG